MATGLLTRARSLTPEAIALGFVASVILAYLFIPFDARYGSPQIRAELTLYTMVQLVAVAGTAMVAARLKADDRAFWSLLTMALVLVLVYDIPWSVNVWRGFPPPATESVASLALLAFPALVFAVVLASLTYVWERSWLARLRYLVGALAIFSVAAVVAILFYAEPLLVASGITETSVIARTGIHAAVGASILGGTLATVLWLKVSAWRVWERALIAAFSVYGATLALTPFYHVDRVTGPTLYSQVHEALLMLGPGLVLIAAISRLREPAELIPLGRHGSTAVRRVWFAATLVASGILFAALFALMGALAESGSFHQTVLLAGSFAVAAFAAAWVLLAADEVGSLQFDAAKDPITGVRSVALFNESLSHEIDLSRRYGVGCAVILADLDGFHRFVSVYGVTVGASILAQTAHALVASLGDKERVYRLEDNLFGCVLPGAARHEAFRAAEEIRSLVKSRTALTVSVGIAVFPDHGEDPSDLIEAATVALRRAKIHGKDRSEVFSPIFVHVACAHGNPLPAELHSHITSLKALAVTVDARNPGTHLHSQRVADLAVAVARHVGLDADRIRLLEVAAFLHDIGKIELSDGVLQNPGPVTETEWEQVREHPLLAERILGSLPLPHIAQWVRAHHECWDGSGYPDGLAGEAIPLEARIIAVCDAYDALTSERAYRTGYSSSAALQEIDLNAGVRWDPYVVEALIAVVESLVEPPHHRPERAFVPTAYRMGRWW